MSLLSSPLFLLLNSVALLGVVGFMAYAKLLYQRPAMTEKKAQAELFPPSLKKETPENPVYISFDPLTFNLLSTPQETARGKMHYATVGFSIELERSFYQKENHEVIEKELKSLVTDLIMGALGKKFPHNLLRIQERYILQSELTDQLNELLCQKLKLPPTHELISQLYFTEWIIQ